MYLTKEQIKAIEKVLADGDRVELIPVKDGIKNFYQEVENPWAKT